MRKNKKGLLKAWLIYSGIVLIMVGLYVGLVLLNIKIILRNPIYYSVFLLSIFSIIGLILLIIFIVFLTQIVRNLDDPYKDTILDKIIDKIFL